MSIDKHLSPEQKAKADELLGTNNKLIAIGYWTGPNTDQDFPHPKKFVDESWDSGERQIAINYLQKHNRVLTYFGISYCRFKCGEFNMGVSDMSDGTFVWPEGLPHYLVKHYVRLPQEFMEHIHRNRDKPLIETKQAVNSLLELDHVDYYWWKSQTGFHR